MWRFLQAVAKRFGTQGNAHAERRAPTGLPWPWRSAAGRQAGSIDIGGAFWQAEPAALLARLHATTNGLAAPEAAARLQRFGANTVEGQATHALLRKLLRRLDPLVLILVGAALLSGLAQDMASFWLIGTIVSLSISLDIVQEHRAETAAEALKRSVAVHADVLRDGVLRSLPVREVVPGDIVELRAGDLVPADGVVLSARDLYANQAMLTGEPYPVEKAPAVVSSDDAAEASNALFMGSSIVSGNGRMLVAATGRATRFGTIAADVLAAEPPSAFERDMRRYGGFIMRLTVVPGAVRVPGARCLRPKLP